MHTLGYAGRPETNIFFMYFILSVNNSNKSINWSTTDDSVMLNTVSRGSGLDCGSEDPGSIPGIPSPRVGPLMDRRLKTSADVPVPVLG